MPKDSTSSAVVPVAQKGESGGFVAAPTVTVPAPVVKAPAGNALVDYASTLAKTGQALAGGVKEANALTAESKLDKTAAIKDVATSAKEITAGKAAQLALSPTVTPPTTSATTSASTLDQSQLDAYATLELAFKEYGLDSLVPVIEGYMKKNIGPQQAALMIRNEQAYKDRFAGNTKRVAAGLNALPENQYLLLENSYMETLAGYGMKNYFGSDRTSMVANMANIIGNDVSATEFATRVKTVSDNVTYGDPQIKAQLKSFYNLSDSDLMAYYLDPTKNSLAQLENKTLTAQIGAAAANQGLATSVTSAGALARQGVTQAQAQTGYAALGQEMPVANKLTSIYGNQGAGYTQAEAEAAQFDTAGAASAKRKRDQLKQLEQAAFAGRSGIVGASSAAGYGGSLGKSIQGKF